MIESRACNLSVCPNTLYFNTFLSTSSMEWKHARMESNVSLAVRRRNVTNVTRWPSRASFVINFHLAPTWCVVASSVERWKKRTQTLARKCKSDEMDRHQHMLIDSPLFKAFAPSPLALTASQTSLRSLEALIPSQLVRPDGHIVATAMGCISDDDEGYGFLSVRCVMMRHTFFYLHRDRTTQRRIFFSSMISLETRYWETGLIIYSYF